MARPELDRFLDAEGRLASWPAKGRIQVAALHWLASKLELGRFYSERELNELLMMHHTFGDPALLRRELFIKRLVDRVADGTQYWKTEAAAVTDPGSGKAPSVSRDPFDLQLTPDKVFVRFRGRLVRTLTGDDAREVRESVNAGDDAATQVLIARKTGNFKRGNERRR